MKSGIGLELRHPDHLTIFQPANGMLDKLDRHAGHFPKRLFHPEQGKRREAVSMIEYRSLSGQPHAAVGAGHDEQHIFLSLGIPG